MTKTKHIKHREGTLSNIQGKTLEEVAAKAGAINKKLEAKADKVYQEAGKISRAKTLERYKAKQEALKNKTYYNKLAAKYLTSDEYERYAKYMGHFNINADMHNKLARNFINEILAPYGIDIDTLNGAMSPFEWKEYKENFKKYPEALKYDEDTKALQEYNKMKTAHKFSLKEHTGGTPVMGNDSTGLYPLYKYSWDSVTGQYTPDTGDDDVDADFWEDSTGALKPYNYDVEWKHKD